MSETKNYNKLYRSDNVSKKFRSRKDGRVYPVSNGASKRRYLFPVEPDKFELIAHDLSPYHTAKMLNAVDILIPPGSKVFASDDGVVSYAKTNMDGNKIVNIVHSDKTITDYRHLSEIDVKKGQKVGKGDVIGLSGATGKIAGGVPHVHYEVDAYDPEEKTYHSVPFEWENPPKTKEKEIHVMYNKPLYDEYTKRRRAIEKTEYKAPD
jgi:murein DD-endopeptidase MepM/ murein hydrolase activator NlpD